MSDQEQLYKCTECGNLFYHEEPPKTIPVGVVWCPRCGMLAERSDSEAEDALEVHKQ